MERTLDARQRQQDRRVESAQLDAVVLAGRLLDEIFVLRDEREDRREGARRLNVEFGCRVRGDA
ncbi:MAG: hypothetical protein U0414_03140 [Polyangiaceae bacterium]